MISMNSQNILISGLIVFTITTISLVYVMNRMKRRNYERVAKIYRLFIYPIKSLPGIEVNRLDIGQSGIQFGPFRDRTWMLVDRENRFITLRQESSLALLKTSFHGNQVWIDGPNLPTLKITYISEKQIKEDLIQTNVWNQFIEGINCGKEAEEWFSNYLQKPGIKLIQHNDTLTPRKSHAQRHNKMTQLKKFPIRFHDESGVLVMNDNSINDLNEKLSDEWKVSHKNFRPNILVNDCLPLEEDNWKYIRIQDIDFTFLKPCHRCLLTTVNPETGVKSGGEPLTTLRKYRLPNEKLKKLYGTAPLFGISFAPENEGSFGCGDDIFAVRYQPNY